ncbi:MAG: hypothetical protein OEM38_04595 [Gammaproteobacteria bacterium]|nr:hypothetical protein [Gammaproteobacteria bacterium]
MTIHCTCRKCNATPAGKNRHSNSNGTAEKMLHSYVLKNGDVLIHWSRYDFDKMYSTEKATYPGGHTVVSGFFMLYPSGSQLPTKTPKRVQTVIGGMANHVYEISSDFMINLGIYTNQFQVYTRDPVPEAISRSPDIEAIVVIGCGNAINFPSSQKFNREAGLTIHACAGFDAFS